MESAFVSVGHSMSFEAKHYYRWGQAHCCLENDNYRAFVQHIRRVGLVATAASCIAFGLVGQYNAQETQILNFDHNQSLVESDFSGRKDLKSAIFSKANCTRSNFKNADLENALLDNANFTEANLDGLNAVNVLATNAKFFRANLRNANFTK